MLSVIWNKFSFEFKLIILLKFDKGLLKVRLAPLISGLFIIVVFQSAWKLVGLFMIVVFQSAWKLVGFPLKEVQVPSNKAGLLMIVEFQSLWKLVGLFVKSL